MCFVFGYLDIVYIWNALIWSASQAFLKYIQSENQKMLIESKQWLYNCFHFTIIPVVGVVL